LKLVVFLAVAYVVLKLIPALKQALRALEHASWEWVIALLALEVISELGFVLAWGAIVDPDNMLARRDHGRRLDQDLAWAQLGGGLLLPGGSWGGMGIDALILHRFGMATEVIAEREFNLSFLNTAIDAIALVLVGVGLATGVLSGESNLLLTLLPAAVVAAGIAVVVLSLPRADAASKRMSARHGKLARTIGTLAAAVRDTQRLLLDRRAWMPILGIAAYLGCDVLVLWCAFLAVHAHPVPGIPIVLMAYIIGALGGSIPLPAAVGTIGGIAAMLIVYGVAHNPALAAVLLHQAVALLVPLIGGTVAYATLRRRFGPLRGAVAGGAGGSADERPG
jgi:Lysylphosphatidylglycerol synthase TM region